MKDEEVEEEKVEKWEEHLTLACCFKCYMCELLHDNLVVDSSYL